METKYKVNFTRENDFHIETFEKSLKKYIKRSSKIKRVFKIIMGSKSNPEFEYNFLFSSSYRKNTNTKIDEASKSSEIYSQIIDNEKIVFAFKDRNKEDLKDFKNKNYKFNHSHYVIDNSKMSINYNGIFAPFGDFHYFPEVLTSGCIFSQIFPCQFDDINEKNTIEKMENYYKKFNQIVGMFINENNITKVSLNAISMGALKFVFSGIDLIKKIEDINLMRRQNNQEEIDLCITIIHPVEDLNKTAPYYINRKIKKLFKTNFKGFVGYFVFKKLPIEKNILFKKELNKIILYFIINFFKKNNYSLSIKEDNFIGQCLAKKNIKEVITLAFDSFTSNVANKIIEDSERKSISDEIKTVLDKIQVYTLYHDDVIGAFDIKNCLFNVRMNYSSSSHDTYILDDNYIHIR